MKTWLTVMVLLSSSMAQAAYIEPMVGVRTGSLYGLTTGLRGGTEWKGWDFSLGYDRTLWANMNSEASISEEGRLDTLGGEIARIIPISGGLRATVGAGVGYAIPSLDREKADNGPIYTFGVGLNYDLGGNWSLGGSVKASWFTTDTHRTISDSHMETLSTGQEVEVEDITHVDNRVRLDGAVLGIAVRYSF